MCQLQILTLVFLIPVCYAILQDVTTENCHIGEHNAHAPVVLLQMGVAGLSSFETSHGAISDSSAATKAAEQGQSASRWASQTKVWISIPVFLLITFALSRCLAREIRQYEESRSMAMPPWHHNAPMLKKIGGSILGLWLIVGMVSFTQLLAFDDAGRNLTFCEAFYLCIQIVTSVGYGDFTPARPAGQAFMACYIILGMCLVAGMLGIMIDQGLHFLPSFTRFAENENKDEQDSDAQSRRLDQHAVVRREWDAIMHALLPCVLSAIIGCIFFCYYPGEDKTLVQAIYMSAVTFTTVGFGAFHPVTQAGYVFGAFWMLFGVACTGNTFMAIRQYMMFARFAHRRKMRLSPETLQHLDTNADGKVTKLEFIRFQLILGGSCDPESFDDASQLFDEIDTEGLGLIYREQTSGMLSQAASKDQTKELKEGPQ